MFVIHKQPSGQYTIIYTLSEQRTLKRIFLYSIRNLSLDDMAQYMLGRGDEDTAEEISAIFRLTNLDKVFVTDTGRVSAVAPIDLV